MFFLTHEVQAACGTTITWQADANTTVWANTNNWNPRNIPDASTETAFIRADWQIPTFPNTNTSLSCLEINSGSMTASASSTLTIINDYFRNLNTGALIVPGGSTFQVSMGGTATQSFENVDTIPRLNINNATTVNLTQAFVVSTDFSITAGSGNINIQGNLETQQTTAITIPASATVTVASGVEWKVNGGLTIAGILKLMPGASLKVANGRTLSVSSGGTLQLAGTSGNAAMIDAYNSSSTFTFNVIGKLNASYFSISRMTSAGINVTGQILDLSNGVINYIPNGGYGLTLGAAATSITTLTGVGFYGQGATTPLNVNATAYTGSVLTFNSYSGIGGAANETDPSNKINWGSAAAVELLLTNNSPSGAPPTTIAASSAYTQFATFAFALSGTSTASNITSIKFTIAGTNNSSDVAGVKVYKDSNSNCVYNAGVDTQVGGTYTPVGSPATFTATFAAGDIQVSDTTTKCVHVLLATSATAQTNNTVGIKISSTDDIVNSQAYSLSSTSGPPVSANTSTITGGAVIRWAGGNGTTMAQANNWSPATAFPTSTTDCQIGNGYSIPIMAGTFSCRNTEFVSGGTLNWNSTANIFQVYGAFTTSTGFTFQNTTTTAILRMIGTSTQSLNLNGHTFPGSVQVNNTTGPVIFESSGTISGSLTLNGGMTRIASGVTLTVGGAIAVNSPATLDIEPGATLIMANGTTMTVALGGTLEIVGDSSSSASIRAASTANSYVINVSGNIKAKYYSLQNLGLTGLTINSGATIDTTYQLQNGSYSYPGVNNAIFLRLLRQVPGNTLDSMTFGSGGSTVTGAKSISTNTTAGTLTVSNYSGNMTGSTYSTSVNYTVSWSAPVNTLDLTQEATAPASSNQGDVVNMGRFGFKQTSAGTFSNTDITYMRLTLTGTGSAADVSSVNLYYDSACSGSGGTLIGTQTFSGSPARADFSGITGATVQASATTPPKRCFYVTYGLSSTATNAATVGVQIQSASHVTNSQNYAFNGSAAPAVSLGTTTIVGTTTYWTGATSTAWALSGNWNGGLPTSALNCVINSATNSPVISTGTQTCKSITIGTGTLTMTGGSLEVYGSFDNTGTFTQAGFPLIIRDNGTTATSQTVSSSGTLSNLQFNKTAGGTVDVGSATLTVTSLINMAAGSNFTLNVPNSKILSASGGITVSAGTLSVASGGTVQIGASQTLTVSGGTVATTGTNDVYPQSLTNKGTFTRQSTGTWNFTATSGTLNLVGFVFEWLGTSGLNIGGTTNVTQINGGQLRSLPTTAGMRAIQLNTTGTLPSTISNFGWYWGSGNSVPAEGTSYFLGYSSGCSNRTVSFDQWFGDFWPYTTTNTDAKISETSCNIVIDKANSPVSLTEFKATPYDGQVVLEWTTGLEWYHKGFNVYRSTSPRAGYTKINQDLIRNDLFNANMHGSYAFIDQQVANGTTYYYKLEDVSTTEERTWQGPRNAKPSSVWGLPPPPLASTIATNPPPSQSPPGNSDSGGAVSPGTGTQPTPATPIYAPPLPHQPIALQEAWSTAGGLKIGVLEDGMYELTYEQMQMAGVLAPFAGSSVQNFKLYFLQQEHAIEVESASGQFSPGDRIRFFAPHTETIESRHSYMLLINDVWSLTPGLRMNTVDVGNLSGESVNASSFPRRVHLEENNVAVFNEPYDQDMDLFVWGLFYGIAGGAKVSLETDVELPHLDEQKDVLVQVLVKSRRTSMDNYNNNLQIYINDLPVQNQTYSGSSVQIVNFQVPANIFAPGRNRIKLEPSASQLVSGEYDMVYIDAIDVTYSQYWWAENDHILLMNTQADHDLTVDGFSQRPDRIYDLSTFAQPDLWIHAISQATDFGYHVTMNTPEEVQKGRRLWISTKEKLLIPDSLELNEGSQLSSPANEADVIYVGTPEMLEAAEPLAELRRQQGYQTKLVPTESVYNEFGQGLVDVGALRQFFIYANTQWAKKPRYYILLGDGTYDPKAYQNSEMKNRFPIKLIKGSAFNYASDHWFVTEPDEWVPFAAIGRIPAQTQQELKDYVSKVIAYEREILRSAQTRLTLLSDRPLYPGENFDEKIIDLKNSITSWNPSMPIQMIQRSQMTDSVFKNKILESFQHSTMIHFMGHGAENTWADLNVFNNNDVDSLQNTTYPVVVAMNCLNASFYDPSSQGLAEKLVMKKDGGAIAFWGSTSMSPPSVQHVYQKAFYEKLFSTTGGMLGDTVKLAKTEAYQQSPFDEVMMSWTILGDPMIKPAAVHRNESILNDGGSLHSGKASSSFGCSAGASFERQSSSVPWDLALSLLLEILICLALIRILQKASF